MLPLNFGSSPSLIASSRMAPVKSKENQNESNKFCNRITKARTSKFPEATLNAGIQCFEMIPETKLNV